MPLPLSTIFVAAAFLFAFAFHAELGAATLLAGAVVNEIVRVYALRNVKPVKQVRAGDTTLIPNRERTPFDISDE